MRQEDRKRPYMGREGAERDVRSVSIHHLPEMWMILAYLKINSKRWGSAMALH